MQNQPGSGPNHEPAETIHDRQAARIRDDAFRGGSPRRGLRVVGWLRNPWNPAPGRLFPDRNVSPDDEK